MGSYETDGMTGLVVGWDGNINELQAGVRVTEGDDSAVGVVVGPESGTCTIAAADIAALCRKQHLAWHCQKRRTG